VSALPTQDAAGSLDLAALPAACYPALVDGLSASLARRSLLDFCKRTMPGFQADPAHVKYLATICEQIERGELRRVVINAPPGHGKSTITQAFAAWALGRDPSRRILAISASEALARRNSRAVRAIVKDETWPFDVKLTSDSVDEWSTTEGGGMRSIGVS
jgi:hypothetical protein